MVGFAAWPFSDGVGIGRGVSTRPPRTHSSANSYSDSPSGESVGTQRIGRPDSAASFESTRPGPTSAATATPASASRRTAAANCTGRVSCAIRLSRTSAGSARNRSETADRYPHAGGRRRSASNCRRSVSSASASSGEWNAVATGTSAAARPASPSSRLASAMPAARPLRTAWLGALWWLSVRPAAAAVAATCEGVPRTLRSPPVPPAIATASARRRDSRTACRSDIAPAATAAPHSPKLCPRTTSQRCPASLSSPRAASEAASVQTCVAYTSVAEDPKSTASCPSAARAAFNASTARRPAGVSAAAGVPRYWLPCPGNSHATRSASVRSNSTA